MRIENSSVLLRQIQNKPPWMNRQKGTAMSMNELINEVDGRSCIEENSATLLETVVKEVLLKHPGKVFSVKEIYDELVSQQLYKFSMFAKTPCNSISTRLSTAVQARYPRLRRAERGHYFAV